jgi:2,3-dihydroxybenzoate decarboxylase
MAAKVITLEEHFWIPELRVVPIGGANTRWVDGLDDLGALRLEDMDAAGIDIQVISHAPAGAQNHPPAESVALSRRANDVLHGAVRAHPDRFAGFALLPTPDPAAAADELDRAVSELGFKGAMIHGLTHGAFIDEPQFAPIFSRAAKLGVPIYLHPAMPHAAVVEAYYKDYPAMLSAAWGFTAETGAMAMRLVLSGVFDRHPELKIILGHLGETLPYTLWRSNNTLTREMPMSRTFAEYFRAHFWLTTSGNFSHPALICAAMEMGVDRILFSVDWPYASNTAARNFIDAAVFAPADRQKILGGNAAALLGL